MMVDFNSLLKNHVDVYLINGVRAGYIDVRIDRRTVPEGIYVYEVRDTSDDGGWYIGNVEDFVLVNHAGTFLTVLCQTKMAKNFIVFPEKFQISGLLTEETLFSA